MQFEDCLNLLLSRAQLSVLQVFRKELEPFNVTPAQYGVLGFLKNHNGATSSQIADYLGIENPSMTGIIDRMDQKGLVTRVADSKDRRVWNIVLCEKGQDMLPGLLKVVERTNQIYEEKLSAKEISEFRDLLRKISSAA